MSLRVKIFLKSKKKNLLNLTIKEKKEVFRMRNKNTHSITMKKKLSKCRLIFYAYSELQYKYGCQLDSNSEIAEIKCNVPIEVSAVEGSFTTDFYCVKTNGEITIYYSKAFG